MNIFAFGRVLWRLFFIQSSWNFNNMQGIGFYHASWPLLRTLRLPETTIRNFARYFNTNPYLAGISVGVALHYEYKHGSHLATDYKSALSSFLGAVGDGFFWATFRPAIFAVGVVLAMYEPTRPFAFWVPLVVYASVTILTRIVGFFMGYHYGMEVIHRLRPDILHTVIDGLKHSHYFLAGLLTTIVLHRITEQFEMAYVALAGGILILTLALFHFMRVNLFVIVAALLVLILEFLGIMQWPHT
jgi:PTS system mannose-specific IID component